MSGPPRVRVVVIGAGLISQAMHLPHLRLLAERFEVVALVDPSRTVRERLAATYAIPITLGSHEQALNSVEADAVLVATPSPTHAQITLDALAAGLHVLVEKPLCIALQDADAIVAARDVAGRVVQVGYNNRFDRAYELFADELPPTSEDLRYISVVVHDPEFGPYFGPGDLIRGADVDPELIAATAAEEDRQVQLAVGEAGPAAVHGFSGGFLGSLVHQVNLVHGMLERLAEPVPGSVIGGDWWSAGPDRGQGLTGSVRLSNGGRWDNAWIQLLAMSDYEERIRLYFDDEVKTLEIPSPWLRQAPTVYSSTRVGSGGRESRSFESYDEAYQLELVHFHDCITAGATCRTPPEQARLDIAVLIEMFRRRDRGR
jgi:predicted dehydrogenase